MGVFSVRGPVALPTGYPAQGVNFNGSTYLARGGALAVDGKSAIISFWFKNTGATGSYRTAVSAGASTSQEGISIFISGANDKIRVFGQRTSDDATALSMTSTSTYVSMSSWKHLLISFNLATSVTQLYINDVDDLAGGGSTTNDNLRFQGTETTVGADLDGTANWVGDFADFQIWFNQYLDISNTTNRRLFITAGGAPVDPATAALTLGTPQLLLEGTVASWNVNNGTGGGMTVAAGSLSASTGPP